MTPLVIIVLAITGASVGAVIGTRMGRKMPPDPRATRSYRRDAVLLRAIGDRTDADATAIRAHLASKYPPGFLKPHNNLHHL